MAQSIQYLGGNTFARVVTDTSAGTVTYQTYANGAWTIQWTLNQANGDITLAQDQTVQGALTVVGNQTLGGTLAVTGTTTLAGNQTVGGTATFSHAPVVPNYSWGQATINTGAVATNQMQGDWGSQASVPAADTQIAHNLGVTPTWVTITEKDTAVSDLVLLHAKSATSITVIAKTSGVDIDWAVIA